MTTVRESIRNYFFSVLLRPSDGWFSRVVNSIRQQFWKFLYSHASSVFASTDTWQFINYGFVPDDGKLLDLSKEDGDDRCGKTCIQLYHEVANAVAIEGKNVVEVGCGRGGGALYIARNLKPKTMTAIDLSPTSIDFANKTVKPKSSNLHFQQGDALNLKLPDNAYDVVVNVESSHCYPDFPKFMSEVYRVLKPGGYLVLCDMRLAAYVAQTEQDMQSAGFAIKVNVDITDNVLKSMKIASPDRDALVRESVGKFAYNMLRPFLISFAGLEGSKMFNEFQAREVIYKRYVLQKLE